ncbi:NADH kinase pos5 [Spiromyces aspiralis]|uniref:NADH kinase pos5 n=1 Tax=Spiromyces aspiralis TaxID=68401 RepID=A0ACC1HTZ3_9FUNG|nr:NADH kinase pos5 [Spiromyces aspiralis]
MLLTPICPRSLSFRTVFLPASSTIRLQVDTASRGPATICTDGNDAGVLEKGQYIEIKRSLYPMMCINSLDPSTGWTYGINNLLKFNQIFSPINKPFFGDNEEGSLPD